VTNRQQEAVDRIRRVKAGERQRTVYGFEDEKMDDFMYRMLENVYVADLKTLADAFLDTLHAGQEVKNHAT